MPLNPMPAPEALAAAYRAYTWDAKHKLYGYPSDTYPQFRWMTSLEERFHWIRDNALTSTGPYLFREMVQWGGSQNGVLQKIDDGADQVCFADQLRTVINALPNAQMAISAALQIPGIGLTYGSKLLRFLDPSRYASLDSRIRRGLIDNHNWVTTAGQPVAIYDGNLSSMIQGYCHFLEALAAIKHSLIASNTACPRSSMNDTDQWRLADIELALFQYLSG